MTYILLIFSFFTFSYAQTYCAGEQVSETHQNQSHVVGAAIEGYEEGGEFRLADWNGALNGGEYHVIFIDMSASW
jgi:hypothetical protein